MLRRTKGTRAGWGRSTVRFAVLLVLTLLAAACSARTVPSQPAAAATTSQAPPAVTAPPSVAIPTQTTTTAPESTSAAPAVASPPAPASPPPAAPDGWIALTFDDGPDDGTYAILDILEAAGVRATFFVVGWKVEQHPEIAQAIVARGHSLQSHGYGHGNWTQMSDTQLRQDLVRATAAIQQATGTTPTCVRPPWGATSARTTAVAESLGLRVVIWDFDSGDYAHQSGRQLVRNAATWTTGSIVLAHDTLHYIWAPVLLGILSDLATEGFQLTPICTAHPGRRAQQQPD